jgi:hypothetical protein
MWQFPSQDVNSRGASITLPFLELEGVGIIVRFVVPLYPQWEVGRWKTIVSGGAHETEDQRHMVLTMFREKKEY